MRIYAIKVWGLGAETWGALGFSKEGVRNNLAGEFKPGDFVLYVGTLNEPTALEEQGRLLGLVKISSTHVDTADLIEPSVWQGHLNQNNGKPKWPFGLPLIEVWRFTSQPLPEERDILPRFREEGLTMKLATNFVELLPSEVAAVLSLSREKVDHIYTSSAIEAAKRREAVRAGLQNPGKGPSPILGRREIFFSIKESSTYCMELVSTEISFRAIDVRREPNERRRIFKIGWSTDAAARQKALNFAFPNPKVLGRRPLLVQKRKSQLDAYKLEQAVLSALASKKLSGRSEMVFCTTDEIQSVFHRKIYELTPSPASEDEDFVVKMEDSDGDFGL